MILGRLNHVAVATPSIAAYCTVFGSTAIEASLDLPEHPTCVTPAKAGVHLSASVCGTMDPGLRRDDGFGACV